MILEMGLYEKIGVKKFFTNTCSCPPEDFLEKCGDFIVLEKASFPTMAVGRNHLYVIVKNGISTLKAFQIIENKMLMRILGYFGLKDENSLSIQYFVAEERTLSPKLCFGNFLLRYLGRTDRLPKPGGNDSNVFFIKLPWERECYDTYRQLKKVGFMPNYYGHQRFGYKEPLNHEKAFRIILGEEKLYSDVKETYGIYKEVLAIIFQSLQSYFFNMCLSELLEYRTLKELMGKAGVLPGYDILEWSPPAWVQRDHYECIVRKVREAGITIGLSKMRRFIRTTIRPLTVSLKKMKLKLLDGGKAILSVELPPSSYASIIIREFFKEREEWIWRRCKPTKLC